jgi:predicted peptidase
MMRKLAFLLAIGALLGLNSCVSLNPKAASVSEQRAQPFSRTVTKTYQGQYLVHLPEGYSASSNQRWPMIIFLHGLGERGNDLELVKKHGPPKLIAQGRDFPFIVISPQCPEGQWWPNNLMLAVLDEVTEKYAVDTNRVYLTGLSMGGFGTWILALECPERFAAIAPICGGGSPYAPVGYDPARAQALKSLPIWVFHGAKDQTVKLEESERMVKFLRGFGCQVEFTIYPEAGHDAWTETYNNPKLNEWFLQHKRSAAAGP